MTEGRERDERAGGDGEVEPSERAGDATCDSNGGSSGKAAEREDGADHGGNGDRNDKDSSDNGDETQDNDNDKPSPLANPKVRIGLVVAAVLAAILLTYWFFHYRSYGRYQQSTNDAYLDADQINVSPRVAGYVEQVLVEDNQVVRKGQPLVTIDRRTTEASAAQSRAQIAQAEAGVAQARATRIQQFDAIHQAVAQANQSRDQLRQAEATNRFNASQVARYAPLSAAGVETNEKLAQNRSNLEQSRAQVASARAQLAASRAQIASARHQIGINDAQIRSNLAQVTAARAQLASSQVDVEGGVVRSRIGGRIGNRTVRVGQYVQVGARMMTVVPVERLFITANFKETQIGLMRVGQPATIEVDALSGEEIHGVVESFAPGTGSRFAQVPVDNATGNFTKIVQRVPVRIRVDAGPEARRVMVPGLSVSVSVDTRGARVDTKTFKQESKDYKKGRERQDERELKRDRDNHMPGAGQ